MRGSRQINGKLPAEREPAGRKSAAHAGANQVLGFLLVPRFSMIAFTSAIEPLRLANRTAEHQLYAWRLYSPDGGPVEASNGIAINVDGAYADARGLASAIVCAGIDVHAFDHRELIAVLRRLATFGAAIGAVCTGTYVLARAGLLDAFRATIHWENRPGLVAEFPELEVSEELFEIDRNRFTCAGGTAAVDMMLSIIARDHGAVIAAEVTDQLIHHRIRDASQHQRMSLRARLGVAHPKLLAVAARMEETIESRLSCAELAREAGISTRQLERLFARYLACSPTRYYLMLRLERARDLLRQTSEPVLSIALACGFVSASHFSKSYSEQYGHTPSDERRLGRSPAAPAERLARSR
jgi:transcriptional regulator GlxA family with amidase domain